MLSEHQKSTQLTFDELNSLDEKVLTEKHNYHAKLTKSDTTGKALMVVGQLVFFIFVGLSVAFNSIIVFCIGAALLAGAIMRGFSLISRSRMHKAMALHTKLLSDLGAEYCDSALHYIKECSAAREWRDQAVAKSRALRGFDYKTISDLYEAQEKDNEAQRLRNKCQQLHGIAI